VTCSLFVTNEDVPDGVLRHELVIKRDDSATGKSEDVGDAEQLERADDGA
jgi:hypothetical protein